MYDTYVQRDVDSPPWGSHREALTPPERARLITLMRACVAADLSLIALLVAALS
jgi:hypothetical protein